MPIKRDKPLNVLKLTKLAPKIKIFRSEISIILINSPKYGFGRNSLRFGKIMQSYFKSIFGSLNSVETFEKKFSGIIGNGDSVSFASGRMAFYSYLKFLKIGHGDEVVITAFTCSVMVNAVLRIGAQPIYVDIDSTNLGTSFSDLPYKITGRTKLVVAQHSFGLPCDIERIVEFCDSLKIPVLEDCALSVGSTVKDLVLGNFGHAAIFSFDKTKPINTHIGGILYSNDKLFIEGIRKANSNIPKLPKSKIASMALYATRESINYKRILRSIFLICEYLLSRKPLNKIYVSPFLDKDSSFKAQERSYPYPAKFPKLFAAIGNYQLVNWKDRAAMRLEKYNEISTLFQLSYDASHFVFFDFSPANKFVPLRFSFLVGRPEEQESFLNRMMNFEDYWFRKPIIATSEPLEKFHYLLGSCPVAEEIGSRIVNIPILDDNREYLKLVKNLKTNLNITK
jgi:perosamine synthetase